MSKHLVPVRSTEELPENKSREISVNVLSDVGQVFYDFVEERWFTVSKHPNKVPVHVWYKEVDHVLSERMLDNPYPESLFIPIPDDKLNAVVKLLKDNGYSSDSLFGNWGRTVWDNCIEAVKQQLK
jgi:hypothetical protein